MLEICQLHVCHCTNYSCTMHLSNDVFIECNCLLTTRTSGTNTANISSVKLHMAATTATMLASWSRMKTNMENVMFKNHVTRTARTLLFWREHYNLLLASLGAAIVLSFYHWMTVLLLLYDLCNTPALKSALPTYFYLLLFAQCFSP